MKHGNADQHRTAETQTPNPIWNTNAEMMTDWQAMTHGAPRGINWFGHIQCHNDNNARPEAWVIFAIPTFTAIFNF